MDRRGFGDSGDAPDYALEREFEDVAAVVEALDGPALLFGHSFGTMCALEAGILTKKLAGLILYEPGIFEREEFCSFAQIKHLEHLLAASDREGIVTAFMSEMMGLPPE